MSGRIFLDAYFAGSFLGGCSMRRMILFFFTWMIGITLVLSAAGTGEAAFRDRAEDMAKLTGIRIGQTDDNIRIVVDADRPVSYTQTVLANPARIIVDVHNAWLSSDMKKNMTISSPLVSRVRTAQFDRNTVRIVVETSVGKGGYRVFSLGGEKPRIVMDFGKRNTGGTNSVPAQPRHPSGGEDRGSLDRDISSITGMKGRRIALDPGHGGSDSGAIGPTGIMEKSITLRVGKELKRLLEAEGATVLMTRTFDTEVSPKGAEATAVEELEARCEIANQGDADIFISIHADAFTNPEVKGTTAYYYTRGSEASRRLADSVRTAVIDAIGTVDRGSQSCNFYVVKHTDMPAILLEISFISNPNEEAMMNSETGIQKIAQGMADGIADYFG